MRGVHVRGWNQLPGVPVKCRHPTTTFYGGPHCFRHADSWLRLSVDCGVHETARLLINTGEKAAGIVGWFSGTGRLARVQTSISNG